MADQNKENWDIVIKPKRGWFDIDLKEIWQYRDLFKLMVKRDFVTVYKQTVLGPIWFFVQPVLMTLTFTIIFGNIAGLSPEGVPTFLFYLTAITIWNYFATCLTSTANTFGVNAKVFDKVYFPRLIVPISSITSGLLKFAVQFSLLLVIWIYYWITDPSVQPNLTLAFFPFLVLMTGGLGLGFGIIISSLTTKYRDFAFLVGFGVSLMMYFSPVLFPLTRIPEKFKVIEKVLALNPMTSIIECWRNGFLGANAGIVNLQYLAYSVVFLAFVLFFGIVVFNRVEKSFVDTV